MLGVGLSHAKRHEVKGHRRAMTGLFYAALLFTGLFMRHAERLIGQAPFAFSRQGSLSVGPLRRSVSRSPPSLAP